MVKKDLEESKSKLENALAILKVWEEDLKKNDMVKLKGKNDCKKMKNPNVRTRQSDE